LGAALSDFVSTLAGGVVVAPPPCARTGAVNTLAARSATANFLNMVLSFSGWRGATPGPRREGSTGCADHGGENARAALNSL
jgi:hypothetical protein